MTPFELSCYTDAYNDKQEELRQQIILQAYMTASLARADKMPSLQSLLDAKSEPDKHELTEEQLLKEIRRMNVAIGGVEIGPDT